jgi:hypothetical protein
MYIGISSHVALVRDHVVALGICRRGPLTLLLLCSGRQGPRRGKRRPGETQRPASWVFSGVGHPLTSGH